MAIVNKVAIIKDIRGFEIKVKLAMTICGELYWEPTVCTKPKPVVEEEPIPEPEPEEAEVE